METRLQNWFCVPFMKPLPTRQLGRTGMQITTLGFGSWAVGGGGWSFGWGPQDDRQSLATIRRALELGVNWIDTAAVYGLGHSETIVGQLLRELPATRRPFIFTKCGLVWDDNDRMAPPRRILTPESIRRECDASLQRLGVERIDLYQFHWPDESGTPVETHGERWPTSCARERFVRRACRTSTSICWRAAKPFGMSTRFSRTSR
jgi:aryl-alcohol dehydrogenase-like predicted oxidoreductase